MNPRPSFREFIEQAWRRIEPATTFVGGFHVEAIADHLEAITRGDLRNLIINIPPRHSKSSLVAVLWPVWEWITDPALRWLFVSYGQPLSTRDSVKRRRLIESDWYRERWADRFALTSDQNQKTRYENDRTGVMLATSVGGTGTGEGGSRIVVDDPHKADEVDSDVQRQSVLDWWDGTMSTRADQPDGAARVIVMQRLHERDLTGHILAKMAEGGEQYDHLVLPAEYEPRVYLCPANLEHDRRTEEGDLLSPERFDAAAIARLKVSLGDRAAGQLQQRPAPAGGAIFRKEWWEGPAARYDAADILDRDIWRRYLSLDTAFKDGDANDYTACVVFEVLNDFRVLVREVWRERLEMPGLLATIRAEARRWNLDGKLQEIIIEDRGSGMSAIQSLRDASDYALSAMIATFNPGATSKTYRARQVTPWCALGCVLLPWPSAAAPWLPDFAGPDGRLFKFPTVEHDDEIDAFTQGLIWLEPTLRESPPAREGAFAA